MIVPNIDNSVFKFGDEGVVYNVEYLVSNNGDKYVKIKLRIVRMQIEGDKMAPRNAQKGTIGYIVPEYAMPRPIDKGWAPDLITNPLCIPSWMTLTYPMFMQMGYYATTIGKQVLGDAFTYEGKFWQGA